MKICSHKYADPKKGPYCPFCGRYLSYCLYPDSAEEWTKDWQDMDRIYTPAEQQLDMRIDGSIARGKPA